METLATFTGSRRQKTYRDVQLSPALNSTPWEQFSGLVSHDPGAVYVFKDDFDTLDTEAANGTWLSTKGTGGTLALAAQACGVLNVPTAASASDYLVLSTQKAVFKLAAGLPIAVEGYLNLTEAATNAASWFFGLTSSITAGWITVAGAPAASYSGAMFWKATGGLALAFQTSNATTRSTIATNVTVVSGQSYILGLVLDPNDGVTANVTYYISTVIAGVRSLLATGTQTLTLASLANMYLAFGVMCGSGGAAETLSVDYVQVYQARVQF
jgi:hypothetical protein